MSIRMREAAFADKTWAIFWAPEGRRIATVAAPSSTAAKRKAPKPFRKYLGEMWVELLAVQGFSVSNHTCK
jgi:hypothetical protein